MLAVSWRGRGIRGEAGEGEADEVGAIDHYAALQEVGVGRGGAS